MSDRELLELAAKAAGIEGWWPDSSASARNKRFWNPLTDDGDALRLAVKLGIHPMGHFEYENCVAEKDEGILGSIWVEVRTNNEPYAATRRAIVRAAAEIGKGMK